MRTLMITILLLLSSIVLRSNEPSDVTITPMVSQGEITGSLTDALNGDPLIGATVVVMRNGQQVNSALVDLSGYFTIKPLSAGVYDVQFSYVGYEPLTISEVPVYADDITLLDRQLSPSAELGTVIVTAPKVVEYQNLLGPIKTSSGTVFNAKEIQELPVRSATDIAALGAGTYQADQGDVLQVRGGRIGATRINVDGMNLDPSFAIPSAAIAQIKVITGGVPAKYGDTTGGIVIITTKSYDFGW